MKFTKPILAGVAALGLLGSWWITRHGVAPVPAAAVLPKPQASSQEPEHTSTARSMPVPPELDMNSQQAAPRDLRAQLRASKDYWAFAESIYADAKHGDGEAQYYLSVALNICDVVYGYFFIERRPGGQTRTLDEAQQLTTTPMGMGITPDQVRDIQGQCQRLMSTKPPPFGVAKEWMEAAVVAEFPIAQSVAATDMAMRVEDDPNSATSRVASREARELALRALRTKDPEVVWRLSSVASFLSDDDPPGEAGIRQWTWVLAACLREASCDSLAEWKRVHCSFDTQCQPYESTLDIIRRAAGNDLSEVERRARELNEKIDAGTLEESDI